MIKDIKYNGYTAQPSDYECRDGQLAASLNLISEDSQLKPLLQPTPISIGLSASQKVVYIHETSSYKHYILLNDKEVGWLNGKSETIQTPAQLATFTGLDIYQFSSIGNTLLVLCSDGIHYFLWKGDTNGYLNLGTKIPECHLSFGLQGEMKRTDRFTITFNGISYDNLVNEFSDDNKTIITDQVLAKVNKFIADESVNKGKFLFPFFVRYAIRLYDGSLTLHSAPILMIAAAGVTPATLWFKIGDNQDNLTKASLRIAGMVHSLDYQLINSQSLPNLQNWKDIIRSIDIFISKPIYTYDQNGKYTHFITDRLNTYSVCKHINQTASESLYPLRYQSHDFQKLYAFTFDPDDLASPLGHLPTPSKDLETIKQEIKSVSQFYLLKSINIDQLSSQRTIIDVPKDYLQSLTSREVMTDDYDSHDTLIPQYAHTYNSRLNITKLSKSLFNDHNPGAMLTFTDGYVYPFEDQTPSFFDGIADTRIFFFINQDGKNIIIEGNRFKTAVYRAPFIFIYYPNPNAYKAVIVTGKNSECYEIPLERHNFLNGAFYFAGWANPSPKGTIPKATSIRTIDIPNKIYTSEINNPFHFPLLGINTVGTGRIMAISTAAKALSQGQFGQFPLYAFTDEGVWALEVSSTGSYSARQPITRDVIIANTDPLQMDSAVLFATDRGIMLISGSQTQCITDVINAKEPFDVLQLPGMAKLHTMLGHDADSCLPTAPFLEFIAECGMLYDYVHQRVIVYNPHYTYAYVYSLKSKEWGMMYSTIEAGINSYPEALAVDHDGALLNFSSMEGEATKGLFVTRPLKLETPDVLKTMDTVIQRGHFQKGHVQSVLYGSRDLFNWYLIWSSKDHYLRGFRGTPYKYFRIACVTSLSDDESIFGASLQFTPRQTNQPR